MASDAARAAPELNPARREGEPVAALAADALLYVADLFTAAADQAPDLREFLLEEARLCRELAPCVAADPLGEPEADVRPAGLDTGTPGVARLVRTHAREAAGRLEAAAMISSRLPAADGAARNRRLVDAGRLGRVASWVRLAPAARIGPNLAELWPLLRALNGPVASGGPSVDGFAALASADPAYETALRAACAVATGLDLSALPAEVQTVWRERMAWPWVSSRLAATPLSPAELARLDAAVRHAEGPWAASPSLVGAWRALAPDEAVEILALIGAHHRVGDGGAPWPLAGFCDRARILPLRCHGGGLLVEVQGRAPGGAPGIATFLLTEERVLAADGASDWIHELNAAVWPGLEDPGARMDYVRLFLTRVRSGGESFQPLEGFEALAHRATDAATLRALCARHAAPVRETGFDEHGRWLFEAVMCHRQCLFVAELALAPEGEIEMIDDRVLVEEAPVRGERMAGLFVTLDPLEAP